MLYFQFNNESKGIFMWFYYSAILLTVVANVFYHILQKSTPLNVNPMLSLIVTYISAAVLCLLLLPLYPEQQGMVESFKRINWVSYAMGFAIVGLELGYLLAYRAGGSISMTAIISNAAVTMLLIPIGLLLFKEQVSLANLIGIALCFSGILLINLK